MFFLIITLTDILTRDKMRIIEIGKLSKNFVEESGLN